jgi:hypothetical protein
VSRALWLVAALLVVACQAPPAAEPSAGARDADRDRQRDSDEDEAPCGWDRMCNPLSLARKYAASDETGEGGCPLRVHTLMASLPAARLHAFSLHDGFIFDGAEEGEKEVRCGYKEPSPCGE